MKLDEAAFSKWGKAFVPLEALMLPGALIGKIKYTER